MTETKIAAFQLTKKAVTPSTGRPKTILRQKSLAINVYYQGKNLTPKPLNPDIYRNAKERQLNVFDEISLSGKESSIAFDSAPRSTMRFRTEVGQTATTMRGSIFHGSLDYLDPVMPSTYTDEMDEGSATESLIFFGTASVDSFTGQRMKKAPTFISLILSETNTFFILDIPTCTALKDTEEGDIAEEQNRNYEYITVGKGRNRKVVDAEAQTVQILKKTRNTVADIIKYKHSHAFASNWEMYDTYHEEKVTSSDDDTISDSSEDLDFMNSQDITSVDSFRMSLDEKQLNRLMKNTRFHEAVCVIERLLANNCFNEEQKRFRGLADPDIFRDDIQYKYSLNLLWTFANSATKGRCVTSLEWNPCNKDLVAVAYGKFYFSETSTGMVMIWNIKNPVQPERTFNFDDPLTTLSFSIKFTPHDEKQNEELEKQKGDAVMRDQAGNKEFIEKYDFYEDDDDSIGDPDFIRKIGKVKNKWDPNLLAIGTYTGRVIVINITSRDIQIVAENIPSFEVIWSLGWRANPDTTKDREQICTTYDDGRVIFYTIENTMELQAQQMMRVAKADGKLKGFEAMRSCSNLTIPVCRYAGARFIRWHPDDPNIYLVGTNEGVVHKCSTNYLNQHLDLFFAHGGPINDLKYSPFSKKIYATCGDDWVLRIWAEGMDWSPTHSTILATIYGKTILLWDFQRKVWKPQSETPSPTGSRNTIVKFIASGKCLVVGDIDGNVHVFSLEDMPFPAFFQENLLFDALEKSLTTNPLIMEKIKKLKRKTLGTN